MADAIVEKRLCSHCNINERARHNNQCSKCHYECLREYRKTEKFKAIAKRYLRSAKGRAKVNAYAKSAKSKARRRKYYLANLPKIRARRAVRYAVETGAIPAASGLSCKECQSTPCTYHHHLGYAPEHHLDVIPLCRSCHAKAG